ncbi:RHS repeat-associated core domain-containing protein [Herbiconiux liangxiaofengii]|uniref:RHS repeat-associated core domain-containing protein n=1 Tax=Herbiconiux liangxiaofengii TaxID=3342795 RepID=UPI0035BB1FFB
MIVTTHLSRRVRRRRRLRVPGAIVLCAALALGAGVTPSIASPAMLAERLAQRTLDHVRDAAAALPLAPDEQTPEPEPIASGSIAPETESTITAESTGASVTFSGRELADPLEVLVTQPDTLGERMLQSAQSESGGLAASRVLEITATSPEGTEVTRFPTTFTRVGVPTDPADADASSGSNSGTGSPDASPSAHAIDVIPGIRLTLPVDDAAVAEHDLDPSTLTIYTREHDGTPWRPIPSYFDATTNAVKGELDHLSQFVVIGIPKRASPRPRVVLDPDDDLGWATTPAPPVTELPYNIALAQGVRALLAVQCLADVTITRDDPATPVVSHSMRAAIAAARTPDATVTLAFDAATGTAWDTGPTSGGSKSYPRGNADDNALGDSFVSTLPGYTGRPARIVGDPRYPAADFAGLPGAVAHLETLYLDNNYDRGVIDDPAGFQAIVNGTAKSIGDYLVSRGANCTSPVTGGWPAPPSAAELERWRSLGYQNNQTYGADPVSFSTGNLVEDEPIFELTGPGDQVIDLTLIYNSQDERESRAGLGWTFGVGARAQRFDDGSVLIVRGDGASFVFRGDGGGGYTAEAGLRQSLRETGAGQLLLTDAQTGENWEFDAADIDGIGELARHVDRQGNVTTLRYGAPVDADTTHFIPLIGITDAGGQTIAVENDSTGHITAFVHPDGRRWTLTYDSGFRLTAITAPDARTRTFTYDAGHRLVTAIDAAGVTDLRNEYDASGRVVKQFDAQNNERLFAYSTTPGGGSTVYTDNEGNQTSFAYDAHHWITARTDAVGNTAHYSYDTAGQVIGYEDEAGRTWSYTYDSAGNVTREVQPNGAVVLSTYTPTGELASRTDEGGPSGAPRTTAFEVSPRGQVTGVVQADGTRLTNTYDASGNLTSAATPSGATTRYTYDDRGNPTSSTDALGATTSLTYDAANRVTSITDALGATTVMQWDVGDRLTSRRDALGGTSSYTYDANDRLTSSTDPTGAVTRYEWDDLFRLVSVTGPAGATTRYEYNREDELVASTDPLGAVTSFALDDLYRAVEITDPNGSAWSRSYDPVGTLVSSTDPLGATTRYEHDEMGNLLRETSPVGLETRSTFDLVGRQTSSMDGAGNTTRYAYDLLDRPVSVTDPSGAASRATFDVDSRLVASTDRRGQTSTFEYDAAGRLVSITDPLGAVTASVYDLAGRVTSQVDALGHTRTFDHDRLGRTTTAADPLGRTTILSYDAAGRLLSTTDPLGHTSAQAYTSTGAVASRTDPTGAVHSFIYDAAGRQTSMIDPLGTETRYAYDPVSQLTAVTEAYEALARPDADTNVRTSYEYTATGLLARATDANGNASIYTYDDAGRLASETNPLGSAWNYRYDAAGRLESQLDAQGQTTSYAYTARSDVAEVRYPGASGPGTVAFEYDANQQPIAMTDATGTTGWTYDPLGRVLSQIDGTGAQLDYSYDQAGRLTSLGLPSGTLIGYEYDDAGHPLATRSPWGSIAYTWDAAGNLASQLRSTGLSTSYAYDDADRVTQIAHHEPTPAPAAGVEPAHPGTVSASLTPSPLSHSSTPVSTIVDRCTSATGYLATRSLPETGSPDDCVKAADYLDRRTAPTAPSPLESVASLTFDYTYDESGNVTTATRTLAPIPSPAIAPTDARSYTYDALNRLTGSTRSDGSTATYGYDAAGNRTSSTSTGPTAAITVTAQFNKANQLVASNTSSSTGRTAAAYDYDPNGNRTSQNESGITTDFGYQADGRLTSVTREGRSSTYAYDGLGRQVATTETSRHGTSEESTTWNGITPIQTTTSSGTTALVTDALGELAFEADLPSADPASWMLLDRLGSTVAQAAGASLTQLAIYDDWGGQSFDTASWTSPTGFTGEATDPGYNLNTYLSRTYDPATGTWLTPDSWRGLLTHPQTAARYAYVTNSPATLIDLDGNRPWDPAVSVQGKSGGSWAYQPATQGRSSSATASDHYAARAQGLPTDYYYSGGGSGYTGGVITDDNCHPQAACRSAESMSIRHRLAKRTPGIGLDPCALDPVGCLWRDAAVKFDEAREWLGRAAGFLRDAAIVGFNSLVELGKIWATAPRSIKNFATSVSRLGKFIPVAGAVFAGVNMGLEWDDQNTWGNTRNGIGFGIASVEVGSGLLTPLVLAPSPALATIGVGAGAVASASSIAGIAWDSLDLVWDWGEEYAW